MFRPGQDVSIVPFSPEPWIINSKSAANWFELSRTTFVFPPKRKLWSDGKCQSSKFYSSMSATRVCCMLFLHEYFWLQPTGNTQAEYVLIGLTSIRIEMKSSDILSVGLTAAWKRTNFRPSVSIQPPPSPADEQISGTQQSVCVAILQWSTHISARDNYRWTLGLLGPGSDNVGLWCFIEDLCLYSLSRWHFPGSSVTSASALRHLSNYPPSLHPMSAGPLS